MKRTLCLLFVLVLMLALCTQAFADDVLYCRMCGKQIPTDSKVCSYCGEPVVLISADSTGNAGAASETKAPAAAADAKAASSSPITQTGAATDPGPFNSGLTASGGSSYGRVRVTKSPTSESVPYGGSCLFIAHADNATSVTWYISNSDGSMITTASEAPQNVSGLYVYGANTDTLHLSGIPSWMNGCKVQACFTGDGGPVYTDIARIWTYQETQQSNCWSFWDLVNSYCWHDPYDWPWYEHPGLWGDPCPWPDPGPGPDPEPWPDPDPDPEPWPNPKPWPDPGPWPIPADPVIEPDLPKSGCSDSDSDNGSFESGNGSFESGNGSFESGNGSFESGNGSFESDFDDTRSSAEVFEPDTSTNASAVSQTEFSSSFDTGLNKKAKKFPFLLVELEE